MITFIRISFFSFSIWLTAAFINGLLYATVFSLGELADVHFAEGFGLCTVFSLVFSFPAACCLWLVFLTRAKAPGLPGILLKVSFVLSLVSCLFIMALPKEVYRGHWLLLTLIILFSSTSSVLLHHGILRSFNKQYDV